MCIIRVSKKSSDKFARVDNRYLQSPLLSLRAKGLLTYLLSKPDDWKVKRSDLIQNSADGRISIMSTIKELEIEGYIKRQVTRDSAGRFHTDYTVYEVSQLEAKKDEGQNPQNGQETKEVVKKADTRPTVAENPQDNAKPKAEEVKPQESPKKEAKTDKVDDLKAMLNVIDNKDDRKNVWEALRVAVSQGKVKNPKAYLAGIIRKYQNGEFTPVLQKGKAAPKVVEKKNPHTVEGIKNCKICDDRGNIAMYVVPQDDFSSISAVSSHRCHHTPHLFESFLNRHKGRIIEVFTATDEKYRKPEGCVEARAEIKRRREVEQKRIEKERREEIAKAEGIKKKIANSTGGFKPVGGLLDDLRRFDNEQAI